MKREKEITDLLRELETWPDEERRKQIIEILFEEKNITIQEILLYIRDHSTL